MATLSEIAQRYGTPTYAYDLSRIRAQIAKLQAHLPKEVDLLYSLKANASLGLCGYVAGHGLGADVASAGELVIAREAGFPSKRILVSGPDKSPAMLSELRSAPEAIVSIDSVSELELLADGLATPHRVLLRLRPDFCSFATCSAGSDSRFGLLLEDVQRCRRHVNSGPIQLVGFHIFAGSQVLDPEAIIHHFRGAVDLALRAAEALKITPEIIDLGGGFGIPYGPNDRELDLAPIADELQSLLARVAPARLTLELGRYIVAPSGWYLTTVLARQTYHGRRAVVVDGGSHHRVDMCGIGLRTRALPPLVIRRDESVGSHSKDDNTPAVAPTDVLGCLSLPSDVLVEAGLLPPLDIGDVLAFRSAAAYGLGAAPVFFHGHVPPAEVAFEGGRIQTLRARTPVAGVLDGQNLLQVE